MYKIKIAYNRKGVKMYCVCRDGKLKYCSNSYESAQRACQIFYNFFRKEGIGWTVHSHQRICCYH